MAFWRRINRSKLSHFANQLKRRQVQVPSSSALCCTPPHAVIGVPQKPLVPLYSLPSEFSFGVRFFAAPVQAKPKKEERETKGPRLNDQITAPFVRLVREEGHDIVSRKEALEHARKLDLDLVEVQGNAKPPVCKIMDFNRERYKRQAIEKERSKIKSQTSLKKGDFKEVRFTLKIEDKDLKIKADTAIRLMKRGYRVKCMAVGNEGEDLGGLLSRFSPLLEDVAVVESGPRVEKKQAYVVVRHVKFGQSKKGRLKKLKTVGALDTLQDETTTSDEDEEPSAESGTKDGIFTTEVQTPTSASVQPKHNDLESVSRTPYSFTSEKSHSPAPAAPPPETVNRYKKKEPAVNKGTVARDTFRPQTQFSDNRRPPTRESEEIGPVNSTFRNVRRYPSNIPRQEPPRPTSPTSSAPGYGVYTARNTSARQEPSHGTSPASASGYGIFSGTNNSARQESLRPTPPSPKSGYGIFSQTNTSGKQDVAEGNKQGGEKR